MAVDIGAEAIIRAAGFTVGYTMINKDKPAEADGIIVKVEIYADENMSGVRVGTFYTTNGNTLKCRAVEVIAGTVFAGSKTEKDVSIAVLTGDYIGLYYTGGRIERDTSGFGGLWYSVTAAPNPDDEWGFTLAGDDAVSLGGYIEALPAGGIQDKSANMGSKMVAAGLI